MSEELELDYNLAELPSAQHRAGLAGLVLMTRWLDRQPKRKGICIITRLEANGMTIRIDQAGVRDLFDQCYAAVKEEQERDTKVTKKRKDGTREEIPPIRLAQRTVVSSKTGKSKEKTVYIYPAVVPSGAYLVSYDPTGKGNSGAWIKLWRDMIWGIMRGVPATREPFDKRAEGLYTKDADIAWKELQRPWDHAVDLPSTYFIGAQASSAENVPFRDRARFQFLLHFWPFVAQIYVPARIIYDKKTKQGKMEFDGYALTIPDVASLRNFCQELPSVLKNNRGIDMFGYRPRDSVIDVAAEGALDLMNKFNQRLAAEGGNQSVSDLLLGVEVVHLEKQGNNIRLRGAARIDPAQSMIDEYARVKVRFHHPLFRRQRLMNVLNERAWFDGFDSLICTTDSEETIGSRFFRADTRTGFEDAKQNRQLMKGETNVETKSEASNRSSLEELIYQLVGTYLTAKLDSKYQLKWSGAKGTPNREVEYSEKKAKIARDAFLSVRSRTGSDFVEYFASTLCSFPQFLNEDGYATLAHELYEDADKVRTLTLLALSARG